MSAETWNYIAEEYAAAKKCLWCPEHASGWTRDEDEGMFHLWQAYHAAVSSDDKDDILYARVLVMMSDELPGLNNYMRFHKHIKPAREAY